MATSRQYPVPGFLSINQTATRQYPIPGFGTVDESISGGTTASLPSVAATSAVGGFTPLVTQPVTGASAAGVVAAPATNVTQTLPSATAATAFGVLSQPVTQPYVGGVRNKRRHPDFWLPHKKPAGKVEIDPAHPLYARGLVSFWAAGFNGNGSGVPDLMGYGPTLSATGTAATIGVTAGGQPGAVLTTNYYSAPYSTNYTKLSPASSGLTLIVRCTFGATPQFEDIFALNLNADPFQAWAILVNSTHNLSGWWNNGGAGTGQQVNDGTTFSPTLGKYYSIAFTLDPTDTAAGANGTARLYVDGVQTAFAGMNAGSITYPTGAGPFFDTGNPITTPIGTQLDYAAFWATPLKAAEIAALAREPYALLRPQAKRLYAFTPPIPNVTASLPSTAASGVAAAPTPQVTQPVTGVTATSAASPPTPAAAVALASTAAATTTAAPVPSVTQPFAAGGAASPALTGAPTPIVAQPVTGAAATARTGTFTVQTGTDTTASLPSVAAASAVGGFTPIVTIAPAGVTAGAQTGSPVVPAVGVAVPSVAANSAAGMLSPDHVALPGVVATSATGTFLVVAKSHFGLNGTFDAFVLPGNPLTPESRKVYIQ